MIEKDSPEGIFLTVCWRTILGMADSVCEQSRWLLTGISAILGLVVANLDSILTVVDRLYLKGAISCLVVSVLLAAVSYLLCTSVKARSEATRRLEAVLNTEQMRDVQSQITMDNSVLLEELCKPFFGPFRRIIKRSGKKAAFDALAPEKAGLSLVVWQAYAMWLSIFLAAIGLIVLVLGIT